MQRTAQQNKALHKYFELVAEALNDAGLDMRATLKPEIAIPWTPESIKEYLWRPVMKAMLKKESTTEMETSDINKVWETINRYLSEKFHLYEPFPSIDELMLNDLNENR